MRTVALDNINIPQALLRTPSGATASTVDNSGGVTWDIPVTGTDASGHTWAWHIDSNSFISMSATGDGAGGITSSLVTVTPKVRFNNLFNANGTDLTSNQLWGANAGATAMEGKTVSGTANQVTVTHGVGTITLATPQNINTGASPTFAGLTLTGFSGAVSAAAGVLSAGTLSVANGGTGLTGGTSGGVLGFTAAGTLASSASLTANAFVIGGGAGATPSSFALGTANQIVGMNAGATANEYKTIAGTTNQITVTHGSGSITLSTPQNIATTSSPTFAGLTLTTPLTIENGGTGAATLPTGFLIGAGTGAITALNNTPWTTYTPTVTLVGGAGNTVPQYVTNSGRYRRIGDVVFYEIYLTGDGGNEGAGTGVLNISLPVAASANRQQPAGTTMTTFVGRYINGGTNNTLSGTIAASATTIAFVAGAGVTAMTGADQNNISRTIYATGFYDV